MIDQLRQMAIFAKTIDHGSFRGAAAELGLSPSVVSHHISQLEETLGVALLYRTTRKLALTKEGERLLVASQRMIESVETELQHLSAFSDAPSGELRLTLPSVLSQSKFVDLIARFTKQFPRIHLTIDFSDMRRSLIEDGFDLAIRMGPKLKKSPNSRTLFKAKRKLVASSGYVKNKPKPLEPRDLLDWDWMSLTPADTVPFKFSKQNVPDQVIKPPSQISTNDAQAIYRLARAGSGLAVVPEFLIGDDVKKERVVVVLPDWELTSIDVFAEWPANAPKHGLIHLALNAFDQKVTNKTDLE